jgi:UDP-N-acetylmuramoylalanine--D-glutamate ligase
MSPHVSVFTTFLPDHLNYYKNDMDAYFADKANIFKYQTEKDFLVVGEDIAEKFQERGNVSELRIAKRSDVPHDLGIHLIGEHNKLNSACALEVAKILGIDRKSIRFAFNHFTGLAGRLELKQMIDGVSYYNDTNATTPDATIAGLRAIGRNKNIILIMGGADKVLDMSGLSAEIPHHTKGLILLAGSGSEKFKVSFPELAITAEANSLDEALQKAKSLATKGDVVLFSPAFASFGMFKNEYDRGEQFNTLLAKLT